ncbi:hypothetical protein I7I50_10261 [Histoplasma capsulatum G186AR]|nr:hypothetical protein I7I52_01500 [Histoplasma capsulatum]QSS69082.1 hypothetical protein I7I50_10261 [Histoplasma capsulatum G186AR]
MGGEGGFERSVPPHNPYDPGAVPTTTRMITTTTASSSSTSTPSSPNINININNTFADSAIDMDCSQTPDTTATTTTMPMPTQMKAITPSPQKSTITITIPIVTERLMRLACLIADLNSSSGNGKNDNDTDNKSSGKKKNNQTHPHMPSLRSLSQQKLIAINRRLDGIEGLLLDLQGDDEIGIDGADEGKEENGDEENEEIEDDKEGGAGKSITKLSASGASASIGNELANTSPTASTIHVSLPASPLSLLSSNQLAPPQLVPKREPPEIEFQANGKDKSQRQVDHRELEVLMRDLQRVTRCLEQRRTECLHLNAVFTVKCEKLAQRILEMEDEIDELRAEKIENAVELEGLKRTMRGLEGWIRSWKMKMHRRDEAGMNLDLDSDSEYTWSSVDSSLFGRAGGKEGWAHSNEVSRLMGVVDGRNDDIDTLMDGIRMWFRDWDEVEEGFRIRARLREQRMAMRLNRGRGVG